MKSIKRAFVLLSVVGGLVSCNDNDSMGHLVKQNVIMASGLNWDTGAIVSMNTLTGKAIIPCGKTDNIFVPQNPSETKQEQIQSNPKSSINCKTKIASLEQPALDSSLQQALKLSKSSMNGTVIVNGQVKPARITVQVTALYHGSHCATIYSGGQELTNCISREEYCAKLAAHGHPC